MARPTRDAPHQAPSRYPPGRIGLISDTHGLLRPEALQFLTGSTLILHGGDIGEPHVLDDLRSIAPVVAVRGNNDTGAWARHLNEVERVHIGDVLLYLIHDLAAMNADPGAQGIRVVVSGHSHKPLAEQRGGVLFVNPGSAGRRRFKLPIAAGELTIRGRSAAVRIVNLEDGREITHS